MEGRFEDAKRAGDELYDFYAPHFQLMPELEYYIPTSLFVLLRFHRWKDVLALSAPPADMHITAVLWHFSRAMSYAALKQFPEAEKEQALFREGKNSLAEGVIYGGNQAKTIMEIASLSLNSKIAEMKQGSLEAVPSLQEAARLQDELHYDEPPDWYFPIRESLGGIFLKLGKFKDAEKTFRDDLAKHPRNGRSLFGLWQSLRGQGRHSDAFWVNREWEKAWQYSSTPLKIDDL
jgi:tetratricopeptide (TPR) repeat protein